MPRATCDRRRDEAVRRALEQRHLLARLGTQRIWIALAPVRVDERALTQVADAAAAPAQEAADGPRLGQHVETRARVVHDLLERCAHVRSAKRDDLAHKRR